MTEEYWKISDEQFPKVIEESIENVKKGELQPIEMVKLFAYFDYFIEKKLINYDINTMESLFLNGINIASINAKYCEDAENELSQISIEHNKPEMEHILERFYKINNDLKDKMYSERAEELFKCMPMKMELFYDTFDMYCKDVPIFKYYDPFQLFQRISCVSNEDIVTIKDLMLKRAKEYKEQIKPEMSNIAKLRQIMYDYLSDKEQTIKTVLISDFAKALDKILKLYDEQNEE